MPRACTVAPADSFSARADLVAGDGGGQEFGAGEARMTFGDGDQRRQRDCADMEHALAMHIVEFKTLDLRAIDESGMRRRELSIGPPDRCRARRIKLLQRLPQDAAPFEIGAVDGATERIEDEKFYPLTDFRRDLLVSQARDELRDRAGVDVVRGRIHA